MSLHWESYYVDEKDFNYLANYNEPIPVSGDVFCGNVGVELRTFTGKFMLALYDANIKAIRKLNSSNPIFKTMPNRDILLLNDFLSNDEINTVIVDGFFGTGKTAMVCSYLVTGILKELNEGNGIPSVYLTKPHESLGRTYGHLPGELFDKIKEEFMSYFQYFERFGHPHLVDKLLESDRNLLNIMVFEYMRGRDIDEGWVVLDEAQNTSYKEMLAFVSRIGDGAKLVIIGDSSPWQIDKKENTPSNNGLTMIKEVFAGKKYAGIVELRTMKHILRGKRLQDIYEKYSQHGEVIGVGGKVS